MKRTFIFGLTIGLGLGVLAVSPAEAKKPPKKTDDVAAVPAADPSDIDQKLADARDDRDRSLDAAAQEKDPAKLEEQKREIFAKYAAICAALHDAATKGGATAAPDAAPAKSKPAKTKTEPVKADKPAKPAADSLDDLKSKLSALNDQSSDLSAQHEAKLLPLQQKLDDAKSSGKQKAIDKAQAAFDKENSSFASKKSDFDSQKADLQKQIDALSPAGPAK